jgi:hypothetical protein
MKHPHDLRLNRRQWLLATTAALTGCGGAGSSNLASALPGTGGTGIGMQGTITGFGSVIVNKTKFDDSAASVYLDGVKQAGSVDLRVGMVANISGSLDGGGTSGSATRIDVWSIASGVVSQLDISGSTFSMAGMNFSTDGATSFEGLANLPAISTGTSLVVWGEQTSADALTWRATRVKLLALPSTTMVRTGLFDATTQTLNGISLSGIDMSSFAGKLVRVDGFFDSLSSVLAVTKATAITATQLIESSGLVEIEGVVTAYTSSSDFYIGMIHVDARNATGTSGVGLNSSVEVTGTIQNGVLIASKVEIESNHSAVQIDITGVVEHFNGVNSFEVRGQNCDASSLLPSLSPTQLSNLHVGTKVHVIGTSRGHETLLVQSIEIGVP